MPTVLAVCLRSPARNLGRLSSPRSSTGSAAYWAAARHLQLLLAAARRAGATVRVPASKVFHFRKVEKRESEKINTEQAAKLKDIMDCFLA